MSTGSMYGNNAGCMLRKQQHASATVKLRGSASPPAGMLLQVLLYFRLPAFSLTCSSSIRMPLPLYTDGGRSALIWAAACVTSFLSMPYKPTSVGSGRKPRRESGNVYWMSWLKPNFRFSTCPARHTSCQLKILHE